MTPEDLLLYVPVLWQSGVDYRLCWTSCLTGALPDNYVKSGELGFVSFRPAILALRAMISTYAACFPSFLCINE